MHVSHFLKPPFPRRFTLNPRERRAAEPLPALDQLHSSFFLVCSVGSVLLLFYSFLYFLFSRRVLVVVVVVIVIVVVIVVVVGIVISFFPSF